MIAYHLNGVLKQREALPQDWDDDREDPVEEQPVVVVLNSDDLTAEEAEAFKKKKEEGITIRCMRLTNVLTDKYMYYEL